MSPTQNMQFSCGKYSYLSGYGMLHHSDIPSTFLQLSEVCHCQRGAFYRRRVYWYRFTNPGPQLQKLVELSASPFPPGCEVFVPWLPYGTLPDVPWFSGCQQSGSMWIRMPRHSKLVCHLDLKPDNVLLSGTGAPWFQLKAVGMPPRGRWNTWSISAQWIWVLVLAA